MNNEQHENYKSSLYTVIRRLSIGTGVALLGKRKGMMLMWIPKCPASLLAPLLCQSFSKPTVTGDTVVEHVLIVSVL